jgi:predicted dithiol-disulfide oxidoreductase (DUF899 family)
MTAHRIVLHKEWLEADRALLAEEKAFARLRDRLSHRRRELWPAGPKVAVVPDRRAGLQPPVSR